MNGNCDDRRTYAPFEYSVCVRFESTELGQLMT